MENKAEPAARDWLSAVARVVIEPTPQRVRLQFDFIETPPTGVSVPEPSAVLLVGLMLAGSAARRWR